MNSSPWISVKDILPPESTQVDVWVKKIISGEDYYVRQCNWYWIKGLNPHRLITWKTFNEKQNPNECVVTHWMTIPKGPNQ